MRIICLEKLEWDQKISEEARSRLVDYIDERWSIVNVPFPRTVVPENITGLPMMLIFSDGSASAYCCMCYLRWPTVNGYFVVLVAAKTRVAPLKVESIPRLEVLGCLISSWRAVAVEEALPFKIAKRRFLTDSTCALAQIHSESAQLNVFNSHRILEIQSFMRPDEWRFVPGEENVSDLGTRGKATIEDIQPGSIYQDGPAWLKLSEEKWPTKTAMEVRSFIPKEEMNSKFAELRCNLVKVAVSQSLFSRLVLKKRSYEKIKRITIIVLRVCNWFLSRHEKWHTP